ncbi:hypothetical protein CPB83DRAFT_923366 [Crepidotus variabilis]|uniref:Uncharacterized protein n=1 Tax=Crepidotus variabilis TaxID=179855 RepID=A0A9P6E304_9AGAR|nr:hypothetical protein CPB83DRAFT_923366 [Crepidotus variabilis]
MTKNTSRHKLAAKPAKTTSRPSAKRLTQGESLFAALQKRRALWSQVQVAKETIKRPNSMAPIKPPQARMPPAATTDKPNLSPPSLSWPPSPPPPHVPHDSRTETPVPPSSPSVTSCLSRDEAQAAESCIEENLMAQLRASLRSLHMEQSKAKARKAAAAKKRAIASAANPAAKLLAESCQYSRHFAYNARKLANIIYDLKSQGRVLGQGNDDMPTA